VLRLSWHSIVGNMSNWHIRSSQTCVGAKGLFLQNVYRLLPWVDHHLLVPSLRPGVLFSNYALRLSRNRPHDPAFVFKHDILVLLYLCLLALFLLLRRQTIA
jgi:hypothetical protein